MTRKRGFGRTKKSIALVLGIVALALRVVTVSALPGDLDTTFGASGIVITDFGSTDGGHDVAIQSDGKIVVVGGSGGEFALARYNINGTLDTTFDADGLVTTTIGAFAEAGAVAIQSDGKIVVAGGGMRGNRKRSS